MGLLYSCSLSFVIFIYSDVIPQSVQRILKSSRVGLFTFPRWFVAGQSEVVVYITCHVVYRVH